MDLEYLEHIKGSPYITEGYWDQLKAKAAQQTGALGAMAGHQIQDPTETRLRSLWGGFLKELKKTMTDWESQVSAMFGPDVQLDEKGQQIKYALDALYQVLVPMDPRKIGTAKPNPDPSRTSERPDSFVKGSAYNRSTTSPSSLKSLAPKQDYNIEEGFWDAANRDVKLNKALGSNDPGKILNAYKGYVISLFNSFMKDAVKSTKLTAQSIYQKLAKIQPSLSGWQASGNMQKVVQNLQKLQTVGDAPEKSSMGTAGQQSGQTTAGGQQPQTGQAPTAGQQHKAGQSGTQSQGTQTPSQGSGIEGGNAKVLPQELPYIILKAIKIINDAVSSDTTHAGKYFADQLPTSFNDPQLTKEIHAPPKPKGGAEDLENVPDEPESPGEFIYNFHSKFRKYPVADFTIQVKPVHESPEVEGLNDTKVEVWWNNQGSHNKIWAVAIKGGHKSQPILIMRFFDQSVNSNAGATTPGNSNFFSTEKILKDADPTGPNKMEGAPKEVLQAIKAQENKLLRSLMVVTTRKAKEFKPKPRKGFQVTKIGDQGEVTYLEKDPKTGKNVERTISQPEVISNLEGTDGKKWYDSLDHYGYFEQWPGVKPKGVEEYDSFRDAVYRVMQEGIEEKTANTLVVQAWAALRPYKSDNLNNITTEELLGVVIEKKSPEQAISPELDDAKKALEGLGFDEDSVAENLPKLWKDLKGQERLHTNPVTSDELVKATLKKNQPSAPEKPASAATPSAPSTPVTKPVSGPEPTTTPTAPVSGKASGEPPTTNPTAPVSDTGKEKAVANASPVGGEQKFGPVKNRRKEIEWTNPKTGQIHMVSADMLEKFAKKYPNFIQSLKASPEVYKKFKALNEPSKKPEGGEGKPQVAERVEIINPFQRSNFL